MPAAAVEGPLRGEWPGSVAGVGRDMRGARDDRGGDSERVAIHRLGARWFVRIGVRAGDRDLPVHACAHGAGIEVVQPERRTAVGHALGGRRRNQQQPVDRAAKLARRGMEPQQARKGMADDDTPSPTERGELGLQRGQPALELRGVRVGQRRVCAT